MSEVADGGAEHNRPLAGRQKAFVEHYLQCWNAAEAARRAGYSEKAAREQGYQNLTLPHIKAEIEARLAPLQMGTDEILVRLTTQARNTLDDFGDIDRFGTFRGDLAKAKARGVLGNIKKIKPAKFGYELEFYDAQAALMHIAKLRGLVVDKVAETDSHGNDLTDEQRAAGVAALLDLARARRAGQAPAEREGLEPSSGASD